MSSTSLRTSTRQARKLQALADINFSLCVKAGITLGTVLSAIVSFL